MTAPQLHTGKTFPVQVDRIDGDATAAFAVAYDDPNPVYLAREAVPPVYVVNHLLRGLHEAMSEAVDPGAIAGVTGGVHAQHDISFHAPIRIGSQIRWRASVHSFTQTKAGVLGAIEFSVYDTDDNLLVQHYWTTMHIGGTIEADSGPALAPHTFPAEARDSPLGSFTYDVPFDQTYRYAGVSHDHAPIHMVDEYAQEMGFPRKFLQGLCTFSMCSGAVVKLAAGGDPDRLRRLAGRFSSPVFPGDQVTIDVFDAGTNDAGNRIAVFEATSAGKTVMRHGWAEIADA